RIITGRQPHVGEVAEESGYLTNVIETLAVFVAQVGEPVRRQRPAEAATADTAKAKSRRLLAGEHQQFDRPPWAEAGRLQCPDRFQPAEHADGAVVPAGERDRVGVRAGTDRGKFWVAADPAGEQVADRIFAN